MSDQAGGRIWRVVQFPVTRLVLAASLTIGSLMLLSHALRWAHAKAAFVPLPQPSWAFLLLFIVVVQCVYTVYVRLVERRRVSEFALPAAPRGLVLGTVLGVCLFSLTIGAIWLTGGYHVLSMNGWTVMTLPLITSIYSGYFEELLFRGILFRIVEEGLGTWWALAISAGFFGLAHVMNPNATAFSTVAILLEAGILLGAAYMFTRTLWLPMAAHFAWNFAQGGIFGVNVSGGTAHGWIRSELTGPAWLSGGAFGAEASIFAIIFCTAAGLGMAGAAYRKGRIVAPFWRRAVLPPEPQSQAAVAQ